MNYCSHCGGEIQFQIPAGDDRQRSVCTLCGRIHYQNPRMVVGCIPRWQDRILLCRRAIEPRFGHWTLPAGYLENGETVADGARRETLEESGATLGGLVPYGMYDLTFVNQIYFFFLGDVVQGEMAAGAESLEVRLFAVDELPFGDLAFTVVETVLERYRRDCRKQSFTFHTGVIAKRFF